MNLGRLWQSGDKPCFCEFYGNLEKSSPYMVNHCPEDPESIHDAHSDRSRFTARQVLWRPHPLPKPQLTPLGKILVLPDLEAIAHVLHE